VEFEEKQASDVLLSLSAVRSGVLACPPAPLDKRGRCGLVVGENEVDGGRFDRGYLVWLVKTTSTSETRNQA
jgi:hypothetical protein